MTGYRPEFKSNRQQIVIGGGFENFKRRLPNLADNPDQPQDISGWEIRKIDFPKGFSLRGWNLQGTTFVECGLPCDFTDAQTNASTMDLCTIENAKGLDENTVDIISPNPFKMIAETPAEVFRSIPRRPQVEPRACAAKIT